MIDKNDENVAPGIARVGNLLPTFYSHALYSFIQTPFVKFPLTNIPREKITRGK